MSLSIPITSFHLTVLRMVVSVCWTGIPLKYESGIWDWIYSWNMGWHGIGTWDCTALTKPLMGFNKSGWD